MSKLLICLSVLLFTSCTYSMNVIQTEGTAQDVLDERLDAKANIKADVPVSFTTT